MKKGNVLAVLLATVGIMLFGTLAVSADAHAGIQSASGKSSVPTAIAENESGAVTSAKASVGKSRKAKASVNPGFPRIHTSLTLTIRPETLGNIEFNCIFTCHLAHSVV